MTKRTFLGAMIAAAVFAHVIVGLAAPNSSAACNPPKFASTYNSATSDFVYWTTDINDSGPIVGRIWSNRTDYTGTCNDGAQTFFYWGTSPGTFGLSFSLGDACVPPGLCPVGTLNLKAWVISSDGTSQESAARQVPETPAGGVNFDFSDRVVAAVPSPYPRFKSTTRVGNNVNVVTLREPIPGDAGSLSTVTGCNIRAATSATRPGSQLPSNVAYLSTVYPTLLKSVSANNGSCAATALSVDCSAGIDRWLVYQIVTNAGPEQYVGPATHIACKPTFGLGGGEDPPQ